MRKPGGWWVGSNDREEAELIRAVYRNLPAGGLVMQFVVVVLCLGVFYLGPERLPELLIWFALSVALLIWQLGLWAWWRSSQLTSAGWRSWSRRLILVCLADGMRWGLATLFLAAPGAADQQVWVCMIVGGAVCASVASWGSYVRAYYAMLFPAMVPYIVWAAFLPDPRYWGVAVLGAILTCALGWRQTRSYTEAVRLRFENLDLAERLAEQKEVAEQASRAKTQFLAAASHDLRQPLHALGLFVAALGRTRGVVAGQRLTAQITETVDAMGGLLGALLDVSQLDAGTITPERQPVAIGPLLVRLCGEQAAELADRPIRLDWVATGAVADTDPVLLERILRNLIGNAVRHTREGRILVGCRRRGQRVLVQVWDTGPGIDAVNRSRIFEEYFQIGNLERDRTKGLGLGLAITQRLAALLDCPLELHSEVGRGSMFSISLPRASGGMPVADAPDEGRTGAGRVFVIDDEQLVRESMSALLRAWGYDVVAADSGDELMARVDMAHPPDLIICDWRLRGEETATAVIDRVRAAYRAMTPALLITGDTAPERLRDAHQTGHILLHKPVAPGRLRAAVGNVIGREGSPRSQALLR